MVRPLPLFVALAILVTACSGSDDSGRAPSNQRDAGTTGGATHAGGATSAGGAVPGGATSSGGRSSGGVAGSGGSGGVAPGGCRFDSDCLQLGCFMCPASHCMNGMCVSGPFPSYAGAGSGGLGNAGSGGSEEDGGAVACGNTTCKSDELCVSNLCTGGLIVCQPRDSSGKCPDGLESSASCPQFPGGGCAPPPCTNPPLYCAPIPSTCTTVPTEATGCSCANSVCRFGGCRVVTSKRTVRCDVQ